MNLTNEIHYHYHYENQNKNSMDFGNINERLKKMAGCSKKCENKFPNKKKKMKRCML